MARQPTLAEILSDDTGRIRPEFGDMLLEPPPRVQAPRRAQVARQAQAQPQPLRPPLGRGWIITGLIIFLLFFIIDVFRDFQARRVEPPDIVHREMVIEPPLAPAAYIPTVYREAVAKDNVLINVKVTGVEESPNLPVTPRPVEKEKIARVIGDFVNIRTQPNLEADIIGKVKQNESLKVICFENGWYRVELVDHNTGYVFGAYVWPRNFDLYPYKIAMLKAGQEKILIKEMGHPSHYQALWPNGETTEVLKEDVEIY